MLRFALVGLAVSLVACTRGPSNSAVYEQNKGLAATLDQGVAAVVKSVEAAAPPELDATCTGVNLTLDQEAVLDPEKNKLGAGNTELVEWRGLSGAFSIFKPGPPGTEEGWKIKDPAGYQLRMTTFKANVPAAQHQLSPGGFLFQGGKAPADPTPPQLVTQIERAKGVQHFLVIRGRPIADDGRSQIVEVHHVEFPGGKYLCGFAFQGKVAAGVQNNDTVQIKRSGGIETRTAGVEDRVGAALRDSVMAELCKQMKTRFEIAVETHGSL
ncbi:MAG: hypothetical protein ABJE95_31405 [Byssovorax sp.]